MMQTILSIFVPLWIMVQLKQLPIIMKRGGGAVKQTLLILDVSMVKSIHVLMINKLCLKDFG